MTNADDTRIPPSGPDSAAAPGSGKLVDHLLDEQAACWRRGQRVPVEDLLARHPGLAQDPEAVLLLIFHEADLREQHGETAQVAEYVRRFPAHETAILQQFEVRPWFKVDGEPPNPTRADPAAGAGAGESPADWPAEAATEVGPGGPAVPPGGLSGDSPRLARRVNSPPAGRPILLSRGRNDWAPS